MIRNYSKVEIIYILIPSPLPLPRTTVSMDTGVMQRKTARQS